MTVHQFLTQYAPKFFFALFIAGLVLAEISPALLSIAMIGLVVSALITTSPSLLFRNLIARKDLLSLACTFIVLLIAFVYSDNMGYLLERLQIKVPFLVLPIAAASITLSRLAFKHILLVFFVIILLVCLGTFVNYLMNYEEITASYLKSKIMPGPVNHIRFSIMVAFAGYTGYYLLKSTQITNFRFEKHLILLSTLFLLLFIHLYSVRSGLIALYAIILVQLILYVIQKREFLKASLAFGTLCLMGISAFFFSPTLRNKIQNTKEDLKVYQNKQSANFNSISTRLISYEVAFEIFNENRLWGCGLGDLEQKNLEIFKARHPDINVPIVPHNQFIYYLASTGIIGTVLFTFLFMCPLFYRKNYRNEFLLMHYIVLLLSFQTEPMLETQLGVGYSLLFLILPLIRIQETQEDFRSASSF